MKIPSGMHGQRRAISPIIATVLIIAVTLIAAVAIGGFVFGIFGSASQTAQVAVTQTTLPAGDFLHTNSGNTFTCTTALPVGQPYLTLTNTGTSAATVTGVTIIWAGVNNAFTDAATCEVGAAGAAGATVASTEFINLPAASVLTSDATTGATVQGQVTLSNGAQVLFSGTFQ